jgi:hypothetical protein
MPALQIKEDTLKKQVTIEKEFCDICGKEASGYTNCDNCGKELCYECGKTELKEYNHAVHFQGSGDGKYCHDCDAKLLANGDKKHAAYRKIAALRNEESGWYEDFKKRSAAAETELSDL